MVENRAGGGTVIGTDAVAKSPADGYTILFVANSFTINAALARNPPFDARRDFTGIASLGFNPHVLVASPSFAPNTVAEVVAAVRAAPGRLSYASFGNGTSGHLGGESFKQAAKVDLQHVPYRGAAPALQDIMGGQVPLMFANLPEALPLIRDNRVKAIAVANAARVPSLPSTPTFEEEGLLDVVSNSWFGMVGRADMPAAIIERLSAAVTGVLSEPEIINRFTQLGITPRPMSPATFNAFLAEEFDRSARIVREANITVD
jgi:tripartite-type tricarboxylate transporter receptor subunit TctC